MWRAWQAWQEGLALFQQVMSMTLMSGRMRRRQMLACPQRIWQRRWRLLVATLGRALEGRAMQRRMIMRAELSVVASCDGKLSRRAALLSVYLILMKSS